MQKNSVSIYQSGQRVLVSGTYAVVGVTLPVTSQARENPIRRLAIGEGFPAYGGREVCWHFINSDLPSDKFPDA